MLGSFWRISFFTGITRDERFDVKVALKVKREHFIRTRGLEEGFSQLQVCPRLILQVRNRSVLTFIIINQYLSTARKIMPRGAVLDSDLRFDFDRKGKAVFFKFRKRVERFGCELVKAWGETWFT